MNLFKSFSIYVFNSILNAAIPFLLLPVLTNYLSTAEYGTLTVIQVFITFSSPFILLGIHGAVNTAYFRIERSMMPSYISSGVVLSFFSMLIVTIIFFLTSPIIQSKLDIPVIWLLLVPVICFFQTITQIVLILYQAQSKPFHYGRYQIGFTAVNLLLSVLFVVGLKWSWEGRLWGILFSYLIFFIFGVFILIRTGFLGNKTSKADMIDILKFGIPLIPHMVSGPIIQVLDRFFLTHYLGKDITGIYNVGYQIGIAVAFVTFPFNQAWVPYLYKKLKDINEQSKLKIVKQSYLFMAGFLVMAGLLYLISPLIFKFLISEEFARAQEYVLPVCFGSAFGGMYYIAANFIFYQKKTKSIAAATLSSATLSIILNLLLIPKMGAMGAAMSFFFSNIFNFIIVWVISNRIYPMPWFFFFKRKFEKN